MKIHYLDLAENLKVPSHLKNNCRMSICGYLREYVTQDKEKVTCKLCIKEIQKIELIK